MTSRDPDKRPTGPALVSLLRDVVIAETVSAAGSAAQMNYSAGDDQDRSRPETLDTLPDEALQRVTAMAARLFDAPLSLVNVLDDDRSWSHSFIGDGLHDSARSITFTPGSALPSVPVVIPDGLAHPEMRHSPLVTGPLGVRFYVSVPLTRHDGHTIGTLSVLDTVPRTISDADLENLRDLAALAVTQLELRQESLRTTNESIPLSAFQTTTPPVRRETTDEQTQAL
jgi:GAF domain-containing protein